MQIKDSNPSRSLPDGPRPHAAGATSGSVRLIEILQKSTQYLKDKGLVSARLEAESILAHLLNTDRINLYLRFDQPVSEEEKEQLRMILKRRAAGEPLQYILGTTEFYGIDLKTCPGVFISQPDSELIIDLAKSFASSRKFNRALDAGCGSGALALALLAEGIAEQVVAVDHSREAVKLTRENAESLSFAKGRIEIVHADIFSADFSFTNNTSFDLIVSNPPYICEDEWPKLPVEIREHEPRNALVSGEDGLDAHRALAGNLPAWLGSDGIFLGEIAANQGKAATEIHKSWASKVHVHPDIEGRDRVVEARK